MMNDVHTLSTDELRQRLDNDRNLQFWNVQTDQFFSGEVIPGSRRKPLNIIERDTACLTAANESGEGQQKRTT